MRHDYEYIMGHGDGINKPFKINLLNWGKPMKLALYYDKFAPEGIVFQYTKGTDERYTRISEIIEVEFPILKKSETVDRHINLLDKEINQITFEALHKCQRLEAEKQDLLFSEKQQ